LGFSHGLAAADPSYAGSEADNPDTFMHRIKTETNYGFGFVLGSSCQTGGSKGKGYQASWQRRGEVDGAMVNVDRKYDRLDAVTRRGSTGETKCQVLGDLAGLRSEVVSLQSRIGSCRICGLVERNSKSEHPRRGSVR